MIPPLAIFLGCLIIAWILIMSYFAIGIFMDARKNLKELGSPNLNKTQEVKNGKNT